MTEKPNLTTLDKTRKAETATDDTPMIVHRVPFVDDNGVQRVKEYGPMPTADYAEWLAKFETGEVDA